MTITHNFMCCTIIFLLKVFRNIRFIEVVNKLWKFNRKCWNLSICISYSIYGPNKKSWDWESIGYWIKKVFNSFLFPCKLPLKRWDTVSKRSIWVFYYKFSNWSHVLGLLSGLWIKYTELRKMFIIFFLKSSIIQNPLYLLQECIRYTFFITQVNFTFQWRWYDVWLNSFKVSSFGLLVVTRIFLNYRSANGIWLL